MRVKFARKNATGLGLGQNVVDLYNESYDRHGSENDKDYSLNDLTIGYESNVYAMVIRRQCTSFYILEPKFNTVAHYPAFCFDIIDNRMSQYWCIRRRIIDPKNYSGQGDAFERTTFAIKEWIEEPRFLEFLVDTKERELRIMNEMIELMDQEFS